MLMRTFQYAPPYTCGMVTRGHIAHFLGFKVENVENLACVTVQEWSKAYIRALPSFTTNLYVPKRKGQCDGVSFFSVCENYVWPR